MCRYSYTVVTDGLIYRHTTESGFNCPLAALEYLKMIWKSYSKIKIELKPRKTGG